jgi:four helix bundle protein
VTYRKWEANVPECLTQDSLWTVEAYRLALFASDLCWRDIQKLKTRRLYSLADQLARAVGGISAQIAEGYSRKTGRDRARFYEYALGSGRESRDWYFKARHVLGPNVTQHRLQLHTHIIRLLMRMVPDQRSRSVREPQPAYGEEERQPILQMEVPF